MAGRGARVLAIDIDTRFVEPLAGDAIEVRRMDIRTDELPEREFDLVHARLLLEHLPDFDFFRLSFESLRDAVVDAGLLSRAEADVAAARFAEDRRLLTPLMMAGIGRR
jgi:Methyltransferase domain